MASMPPFFEQEDCEKLARLISYIPAVIHVQNRIAMGGKDGNDLKTDPKAYTEAVEFAAGQFLAGAARHDELSLFPVE
jgi:hypothetical protein